MPHFHPDDLARWLSTSWCHGVPGNAVTGISTDTRTLRPGELYVAIRGDRFDGHDFVNRAFEKGAAGALVEVGFDGSDRPLLQAKDTVRGLQALAGAFRETWSGVVIGITGSVGKTTVKEMCADILSMQGETHRTAGNYNNQIGLPLSMLSMPPQAGFGVFEIGMNRPGEIGHLTGLLRPDIGIITDIANAHRESFGSLEEIAREKAQLAWRIPDGGKVILDRDSEWFELINNHTCAGVITVSMKDGADYVGHAAGPLSLEVRPRGSSFKTHTFTLSLPGKHMMKNALRAIALGMELGIPPAQAAEGLRRFKPAAMRWETSDIRGVTFINDAYNANPLSMRASLETFTALPEAGRKWAVIGGMHELGDTAAAEHAALGRFIDSLGLDGVVTVGTLGEAVVCRGTASCFHVPAAADAAPILKDCLHPGDAVLLKASRAERLEQVLDVFKEM